MSSSTAFRQTARRRFRVFGKIGTGGQEVDSAKPGKRLPLSGTNFRAGRAEGVSEPARTMPETDS